MFGARAGQAARYADLLVTVGIERGVIGPREVDRVWSRHLFNSVAIAPLIGEGASVVDLGSGAGLPGIPVALARPDLDVTLLEPMARRVRFLEECLEELELANASVRRGRAQDGIPRPVDVVVARAVAPLPALTDLAFGLCRPEGSLLALKGAKAQEEAAVLTGVGGWTAAVHAVADAVGEPVTVVEVRRTAKHGKKAP